MLSPRYSWTNETCYATSKYFINKWLTEMRRNPDFVPGMHRMKNKDILNDFIRYDYSVWDDPIDFGLTIRFVAVNRLEELLSTSSKR